MWHVSLRVVVWQPCELLYTCYLLTYAHTHARTHTHTRTRTRGTVQRIHQHLRDEYQLHWATCGLNLPNKKYSQEFMLLKDEKLKIDYTNTLFGCHLGWCGSRKVVAVFLRGKLASETYRRIIETGTASVRLSVCLSQRVPAAANPLLQLGLLLWTRRAGDIDRLVQQRRANAGSATLSAYVGSWTWTCY